MEIEPTSYGGVIWITGYSAAGKTSLARLVTSSISRSGITAIHLDGDDLRAILGNKWGFEIDERLDLALSYLRLCSHIASHKVVVVISAVAMYDEVFSWFRENVPRAMVVYLEVPEDVRRRRDAKTKKLYSGLTSSNLHYQPPKFPDLTLVNDDDANLLNLSAEIIRDFGEVFAKRADRGRAKHWNEFYGAGNGVAGPSSFAVEVQGTLNQGEVRPIHLVEVGCGNGRDAIYFANSGFSVTAVDTSEAAIAYCRSVHGDAVDFHEGTLEDAKMKGPSVDAVYCRFVLHAMTVEEEDDFLAASLLLLKPGGRLFLEARSINDPLARKGEVLSATERIQGHYRRFIVADELQRKLISLGLHIEAMTESSGLARFDDEDPVVVRVTARMSAT